MLFQWYDRFILPGRNPEQMILALPGTPKDASIQIATKTLEWLRKNKKIEGSWKIWSPGDDVEEDEELKLILEVSEGKLPDGSTLFLIFMRPEKIVTVNQQAGFCNFVVQLALKEAQRLGISMRPPDDDGETYDLGHDWKDG